MSTVLQPDRFLGGQFRNEQQVGNGGSVPDAHYTPFAAGGPAKNTEGVKLAAMAPTPNLGDAEFAVDIQRVDAPRGPNHEESKFDRYKTPSHRQRYFVPSRRIVAADRG